MNHTRTTEDINGNPCKYFSKIMLVIRAIVFFTYTVDVAWISFCQHRNHRQNIEFTLIYWTSVKFIKIKLAIHLFHNYLCM
jgi:hypothetical protein